MNWFFWRRHKCFLCYKKFRKAGGKIQFTSQEGLNERSICEECAKIIEEEHQKVKMKYDRETEDP